MVEKKTYPSAELVHMIKAGGAKKNDAIGHLYSTGKHAILRHIAQRGGRDEDGEDILQDGLLTLILKVESGEFHVQGTASIHTYYFGICKFLWNNEIKKLRKREQKREEVAEFYEKSPEMSPLELMQKKEKYEAFHVQLDKLKKNCKEILLYAASGYKSKELAEMFGFKNEQSLVVKKAKCKKELTILLASSPLQ